MPIPSTRHRVDVADAREAIASGESIIAYARRSGFCRQAVSQALRRAGVVIAHPVAHLRTDADHRLHEFWRQLRARCQNRRSPEFAAYGAKGISLCADWQEFDAFRRWALGHGYRPKRFLVLRVPSRGYTPTNCHWGTRADLRSQSRQVYGPGELGIRAFRETKTAREWSGDQRCVVSLATLCDRLRRGIPPEAAIKTAPNAPLPDPTAHSAALYARAHNTKRQTIDWDRARLLHVEQVLGVAQVAQKLRRSVEAVRSGLDRRGWLRRPPRASHKFKNGRALYRVWNEIRRRCRLASDPDYINVGAKGIRVAAEWATFADFHAWAMNSGYRKGRVLTRLDRARDYGPRNCAWMTRRAAIEFKMPNRRRGDAG